MKLRGGRLVRAALDLAVAALDWRPDVVHAHDWHTAPAVAWLATAGQTDARYRGLATVYTVHNLMHQGTAPWRIFDYLGLVTHRLREERFGERKAELDRVFSETASIGQKDAGFGFGNRLRVISQMPVKFAGRVEAAELEIDYAGVAGECTGFLKVLGSLGWIVR